MDLLQAGMWMSLAIWSESPLHRPSTTALLSTSLMQTLTVT